MRTVYVDVLVVVNIFIDFLLLLGTGRFLQLKSKLLRLILESLLGGAQSLVALLPEIPAALNILLDLLFASALVLIAFGKADFRSFLKRTLVFFGVSFFFCGIMVFIYSAFRPKGMEVYNDVVYFNISPILLIILTLICYYIMRVLRKLTMGETGKRLCTVKLGIAGEAIEFRAVIDTGCEVREPFSGEYVIIAERELFGNKPVLNFQKRIIPFNSLGGQGILEGIRASRIIIDGKEISNRVYIGLCSGVLKSDVKAIVPYALIKI